MSDTAFTSSDAFRLVHMSLGAWVSGALENGFTDNPTDPGSCCDDCARELIHICEMMREIESHTDINPPEVSAND